jgi:hypothetical protein
VACKESREHSTRAAFYFWKSSMKLDPIEISAINASECEKLYVKFFDVVKENGDVKMIAPLKIRTHPKRTIVPVIFIRNEVFTGATKNDVDSIYKEVNLTMALLSLMNGVVYHELQFDCDWTESTKETYFYFLQRAKEMKLPVSATIRLHQVKYKERTGVPPVNKGILMYYNMGEIKADTNNSIYSQKIASKYTPWIKEYPLELDLALPVFSWAIQMRDKKVIGLLNKTNEQNFINDTNFIPVSNSIFKAKRSLFKSGYYYQEGDEAKIEFVSAEQLMEIADHLKDKFKQEPKEIIYYDLDSINLQRYDEKIFKEIGDRFN